MHADKIKEITSETADFYDGMECFRDPNEARENNEGDYLLETMSFKDDGVLRLYTVMPSEDMAERITALEIYRTGFYNGKIGSVSMIGTDKEFRHNGDPVVAPAGALQYISAEDKSAFYFTLRDYYSGEIHPLNINNVKDYVKMVYEDDAPKRMYCTRETLPPFENTLEASEEDEFGG